VDSAISYLKRNHLGVLVKVFGSDEIKERMEGEGVPLTDNDDAKAVFVAHVPEADLADLEVAARAVLKGAPLLTANYGPGYWGTTGIIFSRGAMVAAAISKVTEVEPITVGKPSEVAVEVLSERLGAPSEEVAVIGDDIDMDIGLGHIGGSKTILVRSGLSGGVDMETIPEAKRPHEVVDGVEEILGWL
jgi:ribonucleotide monophosphatase NagD (HAD superfamily)